ncbi:MAG: tRNA (adenosine(37)-N6)-threonylcarbamoyltransferase complex dimerization subunit type 1 TsaB [Bacilli bacterium]|jgi:tRNA threonylcarbamoyladenosine biosynthesis protein TsaB
MKKLILDTATDILFVGLMDDEKIIYNKTLAGRNNHSEHLIKIVSQALSLNNLKVKDLDEIIVGLGPGSYTGSRVSLVVAKMFAFTHNVILKTASSLDMAFSGHFVKDGVYALNLRAKKDYVYCNVIEVKNSLVIKKEEDNFLLKKDFFEKLNNKNIVFLEENDIKFDLLVIVNKLRLETVENIHSLEPNYLRKSL